MSIRRLLTLPFVALVLAIALTTLLAPTPAYANSTITVHPGEVEIADNGRCSLREAIINANNDAATHPDCPAGTGDDTIIIPAGIYILSDAPAPNEDFSVTGDLNIRSNITLQGAGASATILDGNRTDRVLHVATSSAVVVVNDLTIRNGRSPAGADDPIGCPFANCNSRGENGSPGGGIANGGTLTLNRVLVIDNQTGDGGNGGDLISCSSSGDNCSTSGGNGGDGAGIHSSGPSLTIHNSVIQDNRTGNGGVAGANNCTGGATCSVFSGQQGNGGGIHMRGGNDLTMTLSHVSHNSGGDGGGVSCEGTCTITQSSIQNNSATVNGGGLYLSHNSPKVISHTTVANNTTTNSGGGIFVNQGTVTISNVTLSGNAADSNGGGFYNNIATTTLNHVTIANNTADANSSGTGDGGGIFRNFGTLNLRNSVVAGNSDPGGQAPDCWGAITSQFYNHIGNTLGCTFTPGTGDVTGSDPQLGPLADNGGPTLTHALLSDSPAIDIIPTSDASCNPGESTDQRGASRANGPGAGGSACDAGAYEFDSAPPVCFATHNNGTDIFASADSKAVRDAVATASAGGTVKIAGTCAGTVTDGGTDQVIRVTQPITLAGGFTMADWITPSSMQTTTLDALQGGRVISATADLTVQDLTIQNGRTTAIGAAGHGAGINSSQALTLSQVILSNNATTGGSTSGGGAFVSGAAGITGTSFVSNTASFNGGGVYVQSTASITGTSFLSNTARSGGGIYALGASALAETNFTGNQASNGTGGGAYINAAAWITDSTFSSNEAGGSGGGLWTNQGMAVVTGTLFLSNTAVRGGGAYLADDAIVTNSTFLSNTATTSVGGGAATYGDVSVSGSLFSGNWAEDEGGGAYMQGPAHLTATEFISNTSLTDYGGGAYLHATGALTETAFISNTAGSRGGGLYVRGAVSLHQSTFTANSTATLGGGLYANNTAGIMATTFTNNQSVNVNPNLTNGGGAYVANAATILESTFSGNVTSNRGGGAILYDPSTLIATTFVSNTARYGGGLMLHDTSSITGTTFLSNTASEGGGGLATYRAAAITNTTFLSNTSADLGGAIWISNTEGHPVSLVNSLLADNRSLTNRGDAIYLNRASAFEPAGELTLRHNTIANQSSEEGAAIQVISGTVGITNTLIANQAIAIENVDGVVSEDFNLFDNVTTPFSGTVTTGTNSITGTAAFADAANGDFQLTALSDAINTGTDAGITTDFFGDPRPQQGGFDIGFDESSFAPVVANVCFATHNDGTTVYSSADSKAVRDAVAAAPTGGTVKIAGTCAGTVNEDGTEQLVRVTQPITLAGGYTTTNWITPSAVQTTTLDALQVGRVILSTAALTVQDLTVQNGYLTAAFEAGHGAGIHAGQALTLSGVVLYNNAATGTDTDGGGAYMWGVGTIVNTTFLSNTATYRGGGMRHDVFSGGTISGTTFLNNMAYDGGGLSADNGMQITSTTFLSNTASGFGGGASLLGSAGITDTHFIGNSADEDGGGLATGSGLHLTGGFFVDNWADRDGGGVYVGGRGSITGTTFLRNTAGRSGGGLGIEGIHAGPAYVVNSLFVDNRSHSNEGDAVSTDQSGDLVLLHNTIANQTVEDGAAIYISTRSSGFTTAITNTLIANQAIAIENVDGVVSEDFNLFDNVTTPISGTVTSGGSSISGNAAFADTDNGDYQLLAWSDAINAGTDAGITTDFFGDPRPQQGGFDIGFHESPFPSAAGDVSITKTVTPSTAQPGDPITYTLSFTNNGPGTARNVVITDSVPVSVTISGVVSSTTTGVIITQTSGSPNLAWTTSDLPVGAGGVITLTGTVNRDAALFGTAFTNTATITASNDITAANNHADASLTVDALNCPASGTTTLYVTANGAGGMTGAGWDNALASLQDALLFVDACPGLAVSEIWVAAGVYHPDQGLLQIDGDRTSTFQLKNGVALYGGFAGTESTLAERDWETNVTVLSGDLDGNDTVDANDVVTNTANISGDNAYHVVTGSGTDDTAVLDGFTVTAGRANGAFPQERGGGLYNNSGSPTVNNVSFFGNSADYDGGGMYNESSSPTLINVSFSGNSAEGWGGGMINYNNSNPTLANVSFSGNSADDGGGMHNRSNSRPTLINVSFSGNSANRDGGGMYNIFSSSPVLTNVSFSGNFADDDGGGIYNLENSSPTIQNSIFWNNQDNSGTGTADASIFNNSTVSTPTIRYSLVQGWNPTGDGNLDGTDPANDPLFVTTVDPSSAPTSAGDLRLQAGSPAINAGDNGLIPSGVITDLDGNDRIQQGTVDLGAYESSFAAPTPVCFTEYTGDNVTDFSSADSKAVRDAVAAASAGDTVKIAGTCAGTVNEDGTEQLLLVTQPITLAGGYTTTNWLTPSAVQTTTLDALQSGRVISATANLTVQDLTIQNGRTTVASAAGNGAGIHTGQAITLSRVVFYNNAATALSNHGGGAYVGGEATITGTTFLSNTARSGGGIMVEGAVTVTGTAFLTNTARAGGGIYALGASVLTQTDFIGNRATGSAGGGAYINDAAWITVSTFSNNEADGPGGGLWTNNGTAVLTGTTFLSNTATYGGGAYLSNGAVVTNTNFFSNTATGSGGGAAVYNDDAHVSGSVFSANWAGRSGGGMYLVRAAADITATTFLSNTAGDWGGGAYVRNGGAVITDTIFLGNTADGNGGGFAAEEAVSLLRTEFTGNTSASRGGGIYAGDSATIVETTFTDNQSVNIQEWRTSGGGAYVSKAATILESTFSGNVTSDRGGGAYVSGIATLTESTFTDNTARIGGGLILYNPTSITGTTFLSNTASEEGGGLATTRAVAITNTTFLSNTSADLGGAIWISNKAGQPASLVNSLMADNRSLTNRGDAIYLRRETTFFPAGELILRHNTIANRSVEDGAAIYVLDGTVGITNTLIANQAIAIENVDGVVSEDFNLFDSVTTPISGTVTGGGNSITGNAAFVDAAGGDFQLTAASDAIDAGTDAGITSDFFGNARPQGGFDIGFHESPFAPAPGDLAIVKTVTPLTAAPGGAITYTLTFNNMGPGTARNVAISDSVPVSVTVNGVVSSTVGGATIAQTSAAPNLAWAVSDLAPGAGGAITLTGTVSDSLAVGAIITNTATITAGNDITPINNSSSAGVEITDIPIAGLSAESDSPTVLGHSTAFTATITAGSNVTYTWNFGDGSNPVSGAVTSHVYATAGTFTATVTAANDLGSEEAQTVVSVTNASPIADAGDDQSVEVSEVVTLNASGSSDPDGHLPLTYGWSQTGGPAVTLSDAAGVMPTFTAPDSPATLVFSLVVTDSAGLASTPDTVTVSVGDIAISGLSAQSGSPTVLGDSTAFTATITAGSNVTYTWDFGDGSDPASGPMTSHVYAAAGSYTATVTATNDLGSEAAQTVVSVTNAAPIADAGSDQSVEVNEVVTLNGSGSSDPDGHLPLAYGWAQTGGPAVSLSDASEVMPTFTAPDSPATLVFSLVVTDSAGLASAADTVTVNVGDIAIDGLSVENDSPTVLGQSTAFTATITAGSNVTYTWDFGDGNSGSGAQVSHTYVAAGLYTATVTAENGQGSVSATVETTVLSAPSLTIEKMAEPTVIDEGGTVTYTVVVANVGEIPATGVSVTDDMTGTLADGITLAAGETVTYSYALTADDGPRTTVNTASVSSNQTTPITDSVSVQINNVAPTVSASSVPSVTVGVLLTVTAGFSDPGRIDTHTATVDWGDGNGAAPADVDNFSVSASHVFSAAGVYTVTVCVTDDDGGTGCDVLAVTVEDEAITVGNPPAVTNPGDQEATVGVPVTLTLTAEDLDGDALSFSAEGLPPGLSIDAASGVISGTPTSDGEYTVTVSVSDGALSTEVTFVWRVLSAPVEEHSVFLPIIVQFTPVYSNDFATHADGWNLNRLATAPNGQSFLGEFSNETASLTLDNLPTHSQVTVELDLYIIRSWDGNMVEIPDDFIPYRQMRSVDGLFTIGPDKFQVRTGETVLLDTTFANWTQFPQNYPVENSPARTGATAVDTLGYFFQTFPMDTTYRIRLTFDHSDPTLVLDFTGSSLQIIEDESWGIDNVTVWAR